MLRQLFCFLLLRQLLLTVFGLEKKMSAKSAEQRWGKKDFVAAQFKEAKTEERAKMAASLLYKKKELYIGKPIKIVRQELGTYDGFYFSDTIPTYLIFIGSKAGEESWQIVFLPDNDDKIKDIVIHKNGR